MKSNISKIVISYSLVFFAGICFYHNLMQLEEIRVPLPAIRVNQSDIYLVKRSLKPIIYVITATYRRQSQLALLTRMSQTFQLTTDIHWLVVTKGKADKVIVDYLKEIPVKNTLLEFDEKDIIIVPVPKKYTTHTGKGHANRNIALKWLADNDFKDGVIYFADDDNTYNYKIFDEMRKVEKVGLIHVGHFPYTGLSSFIWKEGKIIDYIDPVLLRKFPVDMAAIVVNLSFWRKHETYFIDAAGYLETNFLEGMLVNETVKDLEPLASNKVWAWHTKDKSDRCKNTYINWMIKKHPDSNAEELSKQILCT